MFKDADRPANSFITVIAGIDSQQVFLRKGVDLILETARLLPEARFTLVGADETNPWVKDRPLNVALHPVTDKQGLMNLLNKHRFYMQLSLMEGFPNALCEAMLCGCIPIGSNVAAIPFIIGDTGYVLQKKNADDLAILMRKAMKDSHLNGATARDRIDTNFTTKLRLSQLRRLIDQST
jgi:glycosyltransferase involved in cell wall biosynthesis